MNTTTPRVFIAATRQNEGKTTVSLGLIAALQPAFSAHRLHQARRPALC
jgi:cobyrinic acid a,c-diamide synthase